MDQETRDCLESQITKLEERFEKSMRQYPKAINTKKDMMNLLRLFPKRAKDDLKRIYDCRKDWLLVRKLGGGETVEEIENMKVQEVKNDEGVVVERYLY